MTSKVLEYLGATLSREAGRSLLQPSKHRLAIERRLVGTIAALGIGAGAPASAQVAGAEPALGSRDAFDGLAAAEQEALVAFLKTLRTPRQPSADLLRDDDDH